MWEAVSTVLTSANAWLVLILVLIIVVLLIFAGKRGIFAIHTDKFTVGSNDSELTIIRQQADWAYLYVMSLEGKLTGITTEHDRYFTKYLLERCYDSVVKWITYNHISDNPAYIEIKQSEISSIVFSEDVGEGFRTQEFKTRLNNWVQEIILNLIQIRKIYSKNRRTL